MTGTGVMELIWLVVAVLFGLGVVITWIIKSESSRNFLKAEIKKLKAQIGAFEREKTIMIEEMHALGSGAPAGGDGSSPASQNSMALGKMAERIDELEGENARLKKELNEAKSSLEEVYKALCSK